MPINAYTGLMGSGKSFESVRSVIIPAILAGRDVVTNVEGVNSELIREYCAEKHNKPLASLGHVRHCKNEDLDKPQFFPVPITDELGFEIEDWIPLPHFTYYCRAFKAAHGKDLGKTGYQIMLRALTELRRRELDIGSCLVQSAYKEQKEIDVSSFSNAPSNTVFCDLPEATQSIVQPGDMVVIDEAWRFWGTQSKISGEHRVFFREHRHYVNPNTLVSCDLVVMVQDISDLHRSLKVVVECSFRTTKLKSLGLTKTYRVEMWEGYKLTRTGRLSSEVKKYDPEIFPLYSSYTGGKGVELQVDARQNVFNSKKLLMMIAGCAVAGVLAITFVVRFFNPQGPEPKQAAAAPGQSKSTSVPRRPGDPAPRPIPSPSADFSSEYKIVGEINAGGERLVMLSSGPGRVRYVPASMFAGGGYQMMGRIDGKVVTYFSGPQVNSPSLPGN